MLKCWKQHLRRERDAHCATGKSITTACYSDTLWMLTTIFRSAPLPIYLHNRGNSPHGMVGVPRITCIFFYFKKNIFLRGGGGCPYFPKNFKLQTVGRTDIVKNNLKGYSMAYIKNTFRKISINITYVLLKDFFLIEFQFISPIFLKTF